MKKKQTEAAITDALGTASNEELLKRERRANSAWSKLKRNKTAMVGLVIVSIMILIAVFAPLLAPYDPTALNPIEAFALPGENGHILGCDNVGRDLLSRIIYGSRLSLMVAAARSSASPPISPIRHTASVWGSSRKSSRISVK